MKIYTVPAGVLRSNAYLLTENDKDAVLIDCGGLEPLRFAEEKGLTIREVLLTHGHFDHIGGCRAAQLAGARIGCSETASGLIFTSENLGRTMGVQIPSFSIDFTFRDGETLDRYGMRFVVIATPGHTPGGVCFRCGGDLFTGDTLFLESVGRTDFPGGDASLLRESVRKLLVLPEDLTVHPGHGGPTTIGHERKYNPYV